MKFNLHVLLLLALLGGWNSADAQGLVLNYQGRLSDEALPANGDYDFIFTVHDTATGGSGIGRPVLLHDIPVRAGEFVAPLDFGPGVFTGAPRWLQISVRPAGAGAHMVLEPRQALSPTAYTLHAETAGSVPEGTVAAGQLNTGGVAQFLSYNGGALSWSDPGAASGDVFSLNGSRAYYNNGNVGIGRSTLAGKLEIAAQDALWLVGYQPFLTLYDTSSGNAAARIQTANGSLNLFSESFLSGANPSSFLMLAKNGNVGIGTASPAGKLEIAAQDALRLVGYQPFLTLFDTSSGNAAARIQSANGSLTLFSESFLSGANPSSFLVLANNGNVGIGAVNPVAKLHAETAQPSTAAVYGNATGGVEWVCTARASEAPPCMRRA